MIPNLFIVGAPKCGTTAWYEYLKSHPSIFFPDKKEPHYFLTDFPTYRHVSKREDYLALFRCSGDAEAIGEASPHYLFSRTAAAEIFAFNPGARIIIFVRNHGDYVESLFNQYLYGAMECIHDFQTAWELSDKRHSGNIPPNFKEPGMLNYRESAEFSPQVERYFSVFPSEHIRVFHMRDWIGNPRSVYLEILAFLGLEDDGRVEFPKVNRAHRHRLQFIMRLVQNPPSGVKQVVETVRRIAGRGLGVGELLYRFNRRSGRLVDFDPALKAEIDLYFAADRELLRHRIWKPAGSE